MKAWILIGLVCFLRSCNAQGGTSTGSTGTSVNVGGNKQATLQCIKNEQTNNVEVTFKLKLTTSGQGDLLALDYSQYRLTTPFNISSVPCTKTYDAVNKIYTINTVIALTAGATSQNTCGLLTSTEITTGVVSYNWTIYFQSKPPDAGQPLLVHADDAVYNAVCKSDGLTSNRLEASLTVDAPNLNQELTISSLDVTFVIQLSTANGFIDITSAMTINAGDIIRLKAVYNRGPNYIANVNFGSIYVVDTTVSAFSNFIPSFPLIDSNGCAVTNTNNAGSTAPTFPFTGFKGTNAGTLNTLYTSEFRAWKNDASNQFFAQMHFGACVATNDPVCMDHCSAQIGRKRRQAPVGGGDLGVATVVINIRDPTDKDTTAARSSEANTAIIIGASVGAVVLLVICLMVCVWAVMQRRNQEQKRPVTDFRETIPRYGNKY